MKVCVFTPFHLLFVCSPSVFPSTALTLGLCISRKPGKIIVPGIWKICLQTNPGSLLSLSFLPNSICSQAGHPAASSNWHTVDQAKGFENHLLLLVDQKFTPRNNPGSFFHNQMLSLNKFYSRSRQLHCTSLCLPIPLNMVAVFKQSLHATLT